MSDPRLPPERERRTPEARFRCPVCERFVQATEYGVCPRCGLGPPAAIDTRVSRDELAWDDARARARALAIGSGYWIAVALFAVAIGVCGALLAVC